MRERSRTPLSSRRVAGAVAGALLFALTVTGSAQARAAGGGIGVRLLDVPSKASLDPRARIYIVDHLAPGTVIHRRIEIANTAASGAHVVLYPAAASLGKGAFRAAAGRARNELSTWTRVSPGTSDVAAGKHIKAVVSIAVPSDAAPGERYGAVWAEVRSPDGQITQVSRVGIRMYLSVGPGGPPAADFKITAVTAARSRDGRPTVIARVHNTGGRALDMSGTLRLRAGPGGLKAGPFPANLGTTLAIGATEPVTILLDKRLPAGPWKARVDLHSGLVERAAQATVTFPPTAREATTWSPFVIALAALALLLGMTSLVVFFRRRSPARLSRVG
jgi:hypothetical protein